MITKKKAKNGQGAHPKTLGRKKCFKCGKFIPVDEMVEHMKSHQNVLHYVPSADDDEDEVPASHTQVEEFERTSSSLQRDLDEANEAHADIVKRFNRADRIQHVYREALTDLCRHLATILDLEREF